MKALPFKFNSAVLSSFLTLYLGSLAVFAVPTVTRADTAEATCCEFNVTDGHCAWDGFNSWKEGVGPHPVIHKVERYCVQVKKGEGQKCEDLASNELYFLEGECSRLGALKDSDYPGRYASVVGVRGNVQTKERHFCTKYQDFEKDPENGFHINGAPRVEKLWSNLQGWGVTVTFGYCAKTKPGKGGTLSTTEY